MSSIMPFKIHPRPSPYAAAVHIVIMMAFALSACHSFFPLPQSQRMMLQSKQPSNIVQPRRYITPLPLFRELISDDEEDLRTDIAAIREQSGLEAFLKVDDRICVIKLYAPFCKACKAFGVKFRKLASEKGDRVNAARQIIRLGSARFGEIEYSSNVKLCKFLGIKKFPSVLIYRGGDDGGEKLAEIECKQKTAIEDIVAEMDRFVLATGGG